MRILLISTQAHHYDYLTQFGIDAHHILRYSDPLKAMDNLQELQPDMLVVSAHDFPRHWKPLHVLLRDVSPEAPFFLIIDAPLHSTEKRKAVSMGISGFLTTTDCEGYTSETAVEILRDAAAEHQKTPRQASEASDNKETLTGIIEIPPSVELVPCTIYMHAGGQARLEASAQPSRLPQVSTGSQLFITADFTETIKTLSASVLQSRDDSGITVQMADIHN